MQTISYFASSNFETNEGNRSKNVEHKKSPEFLQGLW
ncbi:hypothetical protein A8938_3103 [Algoriphagus zhangzhouensis]|nr:hypothetical protein A8938_3103 [Algoriphagus zhangzhouensis]